MSLKMVRGVGLEPTRLTTHAPQACLSAYSSTRASGAVRPLIEHPRAPAVQSLLFRGPWHPV